MKFDWKIIGHQKIIEILEEKFFNNKIPSSILLVGPQQIGKFNLAKTLAKIIQCGEDFSFDSEIAKQIDKNIFPDFIQVGDLWQKDKLENFNIIAKTSSFDQKHRKNKNMRSDIISIDDVRSFSEKIFEKPNSSFKICLIRDVHRMSVEAANSFLKILEEPPSKTIFLLTTTHENLLLPTVLSRTCIFQMNLVSNNILQEYLQKENLSQEKKSTLLTLSQGRPERMKKLIQDPDFLLAEQDFYHQLVNFFTPQNLMVKINFLEKILKDDHELKEFFDRLLHFLRSLLIEKIKGKEMDISGKISHSKLIFLINETNLACQRIKQNLNKKLVLEKLLFSF